MFTFRTSYHSKIVISFTIEFNIFKVNPGIMCVQLKLNGANKRSKPTIPSREYVFNFRNLSLFWDIGTSPNSMWKPRYKIYQTLLNISYL